MTETWRPVVGYEGLYEVSDLGRVRNGSKILAPSSTQAGYKIIVLHANAVRRNKLVSRLVLEAFRGPAPQDNEAAHNNGKNDDNALSNLRWATPASNRADQIKHDTKLVRNGEALGRGVLNRTSVERIRDLRKQGCTHRQISRWIGTCLSNVAYVLQGRTWSHV